MSLKLIFNVTDQDFMLRVQGRGRENVRTKFA